jgi:hypothetical protein
LYAFLVMLKKIVRGCLRPWRSGGEPEANLEVSKSSKNLQGVELFPALPACFQCLVCGFEGMMGCSGTRFVLPTAEDWKCRTGLKRDASF